jgi:hypothetical protein
MPTNMPDVCVVAPTSTSTHGGQSLRTSTAAGAHGLNHNPRTRGAPCVNSLVVVDLRGMFIHVTTPFVGSRPDIDCVKDMPHFLRSHELFTMDMHRLIRDDMGNVKAYQELILGDKVG